MRWWLTVVITIGIPAGVAGQAPPGTDVFVAPLELSGQRLTIGAPTNLTKRPGYDNQPSFTPDGKSLLYTVVRGGGPRGTTQSDILRLDLGSGTSAELIATPESEYSATVMPGGSAVAVIRVELDSTQRLWAFPLAGGAPRVLLERIKPVGYQAWLDSTTVGVFVLGSPATLQVANLRTGTAKILLSDIGRAVQRVPGRRAISVTHRVSEKDWWIVEVDAETGATKPVVAMPSQGDYFVWLADGSLLSASGNTFLRYRPGVDREWQPVGVASGVKGISRLAVSPTGDRIAFVAEDQP